MTIAFIELQRRFEKYQAGDTPENLAQRSYMRAFMGREAGLAWGDLLQHRLVVVLGEPGSGKTEELKAQQARRLDSNFFLPLNRLVSDEVITILDDDENQRFARWKRGSGEATFFLDAVDESKLVRADDFFIALDRVKKAIGPAMGRARFVISSRISEWRPEVDEVGVLQRFGVDRIHGKVREKAAQHQAFIRDASSSNFSYTEADEGERDAAILVVTLLPLTSSQVAHYAGARGVRNSQEFIAALDESDAWDFAGRPLDVDLLYSYWNDKDHLGNLTDLSEYMIARLLAEVPGKERQTELALAEAREGAELLAAAAVFCRRLKFRVSENEGIGGEGLMSPADILPETWMPNKRLDLIGRALFDAASYGAMSFHHRYHSDYLAASWIARLMNGGCTLAALEDLLFANVDGQRVMRPSLKPVAAWLITEETEPWGRTLAEWILDSCPEIHLVHGDPAALPLEYRRKILGKLVERYQGRKHVMLNLDHAALARFANKGLAEEINRYLADKSIAEDLRADLLMVVRAGKLHACIPTALEIFADKYTSDNLRSYVATVIRDTGETSHRQQLAQLWQALPEISNTLLARLCEALFPYAMGAEGLLALIRRCEKVPRYSTDLPYFIDAVLRRSLGSAQAQELLIGLLALLSVTPLQDGTKLSKQYFWVSTLLPACLRCMLAERELSNAAQESVVAAIFVLEQVERELDSSLLKLDQENEPSFQQMFAIHADLRRRLFWARVARYRDKHGKEPNPFALGGYGSLIELIPEDSEWLLVDAGDDLPLADRRLALEIAANKLWSARQNLLCSIWVLLRHVNGEKELAVFCRQHAWNRLRAPFVDIWFKYFHHKLLEKYWWSNKRYRLQRFYGGLRDRWWLWRHLADLCNGLYPPTLSYLARLAEGDSNTQYGGSDWGKVAKEWGRFIANAARQGCIVTWRKFSPPLPHEKQESNAVDHRVVVGLVGLQTQWREGSLDLFALSAADAELLTLYACNELNGFPAWFPALLEQRPAEAGRVLGRAVSGEWNYPAEMEHVHDVVARLAWMPNPVGWLARIVMVRLAVSDPANQSMLEYALAVILRSGADVLADLLEIAKTRIASYTAEQPQWFNWMNVWFQLDALPALDYLESVLAAQGDKADELVIRLCAAMSGRYGEQRQVGNPSYRKPEALVRLIPLLHRHIREDEDIHRAGQGVYSSGPRDHAQDFRDGLLRLLANSKEPGADDALRALLDAPELSGSRDWILHLLDEHKYLMVDDAPWEPGDVRQFVKEHRSEPRSDYQLFRLIVRLLEDIKGQVERSENAANRLAVREEDREKDFRGYLYGQLSNRSFNWFSVTQESEVDLGQRPDIRVERPELHGLPIEIKLASLKHWNVEKLLEGLEDQLVGQYLRPVSIRHGIYVLGSAEPKRRWKKPGTEELIDFKALVSLIQARAAELQLERRADVDGIEVVGIDFSDPRER